MHARGLDFPDDKPPSFSAGTTTRYSVLSSTAEVCRIAMGLYRPVASFSLVDVVAELVCRDWYIGFPQHHESGIQIPGLKGPSRYLPREAVG